jgi:hypothetical protein
MRSYTIHRFITLLTMVLIGCSNQQRPAAPGSELKIHPSTINGTRQKVVFSTGACELTDCTKGPRFAVDDAQLLIAVQRTASAAPEDCLPTGWSVRVIDPAVATVERFEREPIHMICEAQGGVSATVQLHPVAAGASALEVVDDSGAVVDTLPFQTDVAARVVLHVDGIGPVDTLSLRVGEQVEAWTTVEDAAGAELAVSAGSRSWHLDGDAATVQGVTYDTSVGQWPWVAGTKPGLGTLGLAAGPLLRSVPIHVTP